MLAHRTTRRDVSRRVALPRDPSVTFTQLHAGRSYGYSYTGPKWRCDVCDRTGYSDGDPNDRDPSAWSGSWWFYTCLRGHSPCPWCGTQLTVRLDGTPRVHSRCPDRPDDVELLRLVTAEARDVARLGVRGPLTRAATELLERLTTRPQPEDPRD